ncbi:FAD-binding oxidoreductase [Agromyces sp. ISL-38]|uniref:FAD-binding oxidoreductase n=1 Tax=Agromyces sp. ISL-38 TaxID=2819107 RepID=UPI001BE50E3F|nr:FAD-binding oxidoreductase [Agromyces sp. ISL-38]MBT2497874.1 FAD-binding oxidoreductase [Agromyces sp. ISL-38]MBT2517036.1 FAD-binding oxidoreductase [Streptomyces sp. ISL-90]
MTPTTPDLAGLAATLTELLGERGVSVDLATRERASVDGCKLSPVISAKLPLGLADIVAYPTSAQQIAQVVAAAVRHGVPITPRGKGTGNYGQGIPMSGGLVLDMSRARTIVEVGDGFVTADAGAVLAMIENQAWSAGQQLLLYPSTAQSTLGGFLSGGSGGTGSIAHGVIAGGPFVVALDVVHATSDAELVHFEGEAAQPYLHNYGTAGIIARATVRLEPLQEWRAFYASFDDFSQALSIIRQVGDLEPTPRLVSADLPTLADALPSNAGIPKGRASLRAILDARAVAAAAALVESVGGVVEDVRDGAQEVMRLSMISYNHPIEWLQKAYPGTYFHVEVGGDALVERIDEVHAVYAGGMLHIEAQKGRPIGMLAGEYESEEAVVAGFATLAELGVNTHNPHQWYVDVEIERTRELKAETDPQALLNPGKLPAPAPTSAVSNPLMVSGTTA